MPVHVVCPECGATTTLDPSAPAGGTIPCRQCNIQLPVPAAKPATPPPLPPRPPAGGPPPLPPALPTATVGDFEVLEDELIDRGRPAVGRRSRYEDEDDEGDRPRRYRDDEEDEDDARPARSRSRDEADEEEDRPTRSRSRDEDDEDETPPRGLRADEDEDDEEDIPRGRRVADDEDDEHEDDGRPARRRSKSRLPLVLGLLFLLLLGAGGAVGGYYWWQSQTTDDLGPVAINNNNAPNGGQPPVRPNVPDGKGPNNPPPGKKDTSPKQPDAWKPADRPLPIRPVQFDGDRKTVALPGTVSDVCAGGDGRYLFVHCPDERKLLVFDVSAAEVVKEFPTGGKDARFAAGATKLLLFDGVIRAVQCIDLVTLEKDKEVPLPVPGTIRDIALGSGSSGPALVVSDAPADAWPVHFVDVDTLAAADVGWAAPPAADLPRDLRFQASADGTRFVAVPTGQNAQGAVLVTRAGKALTASRIAPDAALGFALLSAEGQTIYTQHGASSVPPPRTRTNTPPVPNTYAVPAVTGRFDVRVRPGDTPDAVQVSVSRNYKGSELASVGGVPQPTQPNEPGAPARLINYVPDAQAVFVVQPARKRLEAVKLPLFAKGPTGVAVTSTAPNSFTPGKRFEYPVRVLTAADKVSFRISGLTGAQVRPDGTVHWDVPTDEKRDQVTFNVTIATDADRTFQSVRLFNTAVAAPTPKAEPKKEPMPKSPEPNAPAIAAGAKLVQPAKAAVPIPPATVSGPHAEVALPGRAVDVCVGGGGRYLIFHVPTARKLVVFDTSTLKADRSQAVATDELLFAAGMDKLLVVYPGERVVVRYDLATLKPEGDTILPTPQRPTFAAMGSATAGPLILGGVPAQDNASKMYLTFLDVPTLQQVKIDKAEGEFQVSAAAAAHLRVSANGQTVGLWRARLLPSGVQIARLEGNTIRGAYKADSAGIVVPGPDGQKVYTEKGVYDLKAQPDGPRTTMVPAVQGTGHLTITGPAGGKQTVAVWGAGDKPLATFDSLPGFTGERNPFERDNPNLALDHRLFWVPDAGVLIAVAPTGDKLHVYPVKK